MFKAHYSSNGRKISTRRGGKINRRKITRLYFQHAVIIMRSVAKIKSFFGEVTRRRYIVVRYTA